MKTARWCIAVALYVVALGGWAVVAVFSAAAFVCPRSRWPD